MRISSFFYIFSFLNSFLLCFDVANVEIRVKNGKGNAWPVVDGIRSMRRSAHHLRRVKNETREKSDRFSISFRPRRRFLESVSKVRNSIPSSEMVSLRGVSSSFRENRASGNRHSLSRLPTGTPEKSLKNAIFKLRIPFPHSPYRNKVRLIPVLILHSNLIIFERLPKILSGLQYTYPPKKTSIRYPSVPTGLGFTTNTSEFSLPTHLKILSKHLKRIHPSSSSLIQ